MSNTNCNTCRWSCASMTKDNRKAILLCLHPKNGSKGKEAAEACADWQREPGTHEPEVE